MIHDHNKPVFGCTECIKERGPLHRPLNGKVNEVRNEFKQLNLILERRIADKDEDAIFALLDKLDNLIEEIYNEALIIQSERLVTYVDTDPFGVCGNYNYNLELHKSGR